MLLSEELLTTPPLSSYTTSKSLTGARFIHRSRNVTDPDTLSSCDTVHAPPSSLIEALPFPFRIGMDLLLGEVGHACLADGGGRCSVIREESPPADEMKSWELSRYVNDVGGAT